MEKQFLFERSLKPDELAQKVFAIGLVINYGQQFQVNLVKADNLKQAVLLAIDDFQKNNKKAFGPIQSIAVEKTLGELLPFQFVEVEEPKNEHNILMKNIVNNNDINLYLDNLEKFSSAEKEYLKSQIHLL